MSPFFKFPAVSQNAISEDRILEICSSSPRRVQLSTWDYDALVAPGTFGNTDWQVSFPFRETLVPLFVYSNPAPNKGFYYSKSGSRIGAFLDNPSEKDLSNTREWITSVGKYVAIRDLLCLSFALDYDRIGGVPEYDKTLVGNLRQHAKTYGNSPSDLTFSSAQSLASLCIDFINEIGYYSHVGGVISMPPSDTQTPFDLPSYIADAIEHELGIENLNNCITSYPRNSIKNSPLTTKLDTLRDTIDVYPDDIRGKQILVVDDLYQSGTSLNYLAMLLLGAGAEAVLGLACEKTLRNDDNVS